MTEELTQMPSVTHQRLNKRRYPILLQIILQIRIVPSLYRINETQVRESG